MQNMLKTVLFIFLILLEETLFIVGMHQLIVKETSRVRKVKQDQQLCEKLISEDMKCFPIAMAYRDEIFYIDSFGASRSQGGHEGCDIMDNQNEAGRIPIVSATDGVVTNIGWLYLGGWRIGITSENGFYYYYAHLDSYSAGLAVGKGIKAGELLGFMGNSGEGVEGTTGNFDVHLHFGIYKTDEKGQEEAVNSYPFLQKNDTQ